jgi:general secretion pathway protein F/type IV pilus assembly protein PilC
MFSRIAEMYEQDVEKALTRLTALAQPVILIVMGLVVGVILLAVLLPMLDVTGFAA